MDILSRMEGTKVWNEILELIVKITPWLSTAYVINRVVKEVAKYWSDVRRNELEAIVDTKMKPQIDNLSEKIEDLSKAIWSIKNK